MKKKSDFINSELIRLSCEWAHYVSECFTLSRWRSFTFSVASDGPHFFPSMSPRSMVHPLTSWEWHRTLTYNCICAQRLHSRNVLALCYIGINHLWSIGWLGFFLVLLGKKKFLFSLVDQVLKRLKKHWLFASLDIHRRSVPCFNWKRSERERPTAPTHASCVWNNWFQKNTILVKNPLWRKVARNVLYSNAAYGDLKPTWQLELSLI